MKKITIAGLIFAAGLVLLGAGCAAGKPAENTNANANTNTNTPATEGNVNAINPGVTEEELNQLKLEINGMDYEDLNGFKN
jgi:hypothetical protein